MRRWASGVDKVTTLPREIWKAVPSLQFYQASNKGRIKRLPIIDARGWRRKAVLLHGDGWRLEKRWHQRAALILLTFVGPPAPGQYLSRHLDDTRGNNNLENLAWGDDADNHADAIRNGISFVSYGRLGKPCTEATKAKIREALLGRPTGRKITPAHRAALLTGYRRKFPEKSKPLTMPCACGCGHLARPGNCFIHGHTGGRKEKQNGFV